jgi:ABC-type cobalt transport system substrate-binding protein
MPEFMLKQFVTAIIVVVAFIILAIILLNAKVGGDFYYTGCEGELGGKFIKGANGRANPICSSLAEKEKCELLTYENITRFEESLPVCIWSQTGIDTDDDGRPDVQCFLNSQLDCEDFSQATAPKCQDVPDCRPMSAIKAAVERLKPW